MATVLNLKGNKMINYILTDAAKKLEQKGLNVHPLRGTPNSAGMDLRACIDERLTLLPNTGAKIDLGVKIFLNTDKYILPLLDGSSCTVLQLAAMLLPRSSNSGFMLTNTIGLLDCDYQDGLFAKVINRSDIPIHIEPAERIVQAVIFPTINIPWNRVDFFTETTTRNGGNGSTGRF